MDKKYVFLIIALVILDQLSKYFFVKTVNTGAAFGLFQGYNWLFVILSFVVLIVLIFYFKQNKLVISLALSGVAGNLIDRLFLGHVRDFIDVGFWPVFNLADSYIVVGVLLLGYNVFKKK